MITRDTGEECPRCGKNSFHFLTKLIKAPQYSKLPHAPKFIPQIKQVCTNCKQWLRFAIQSEELIADLNQEEEDALNLND